MKKIYENSEELHTKAIVFYGKTADSKLYVDDQYTEQATEEVAARAFMTGVMMIHTVSGSTVTMRKPVEMTGNKFKTITASGSGTVTTAFTEWVAKAAV